MTIHNIPLQVSVLKCLRIKIPPGRNCTIIVPRPFVAQVRWYHNNVEADSDRYQCIHEGGFYCLDIVPVTLDDEGLWVCTAQNYAGKSSTAARLSLIGERLSK